MEGGTHRTNSAAAHKATGKRERGLKKEEQKKQEEQKENCTGRRSGRISWLLFWAANPFWLATINNETLTRQRHNL